MLKGLHDDPLVCGWGVGQAKCHDDPNVGTPLDDESNFVSVEWLHLDRVVAALTIYE